MNIIFNLKFSLILSSMLVLAGTSLWGQVSPLPTVKVRVEIESAELLAAGYFAQQKEIIEQDLTNSVTAKIRSLPSFQFLQWSSDSQPQPNAVELTIAVVDKPTLNSEFVNVQVEYRVSGHNVSPLNGVLTEYPSGHSNRSGVFPPTGRRLYQRTT